jgi:putative ABC transport system permease protein
MSVRTAVGASRPRLLRQVVTEAMVLATAAGIMAVALAWVGSAAAETVMPEEVRWSSVYEFGLEGRTLAFTFLLTWLVGLVLGALPALQASRLGARGTKGIGRMTTPSPAQHRLEHLLLGIEVAMAVALLAGAGLFMNSFTRLTSTDPGFEPERVLTLDLSLSETRYSTPVERADFFRRLGERIDAIPGVEGVARAVGLPPRAGMSFGDALQTAEGVVPDEQPFWVPLAGAGPDYLEVLGIELQAGRPLEPEDAGLRNVVVDRPMADLLWPGEGALGRQFKVGDEGQPFTVVGVTEDLKLLGMDDRRGRFDYLYALADTAAGSFGSLAIRTAGEPEALMPAIRQAVFEIDGEQPISELITGEQALAGSLQKPRFLVTVMGLLAAVATILAMIGIYGIAAYVVGQRRKEIGIRIALGAPIARVRFRVLSRAVAWSLAGTVLGLTLAVMLDGAAGELLYDVAPGDPWTYAAAAMLMLVVATLAGDAPARRAARVDPVEVLKTE